MQVTRVHLLNDEKGQCVWMDTTWGDIDMAMPISEAMAKCLTVDIHNQVVDGRGRVAPTPWGWYWMSNGQGGHLPVPEMIYHIHPPHYPIDHIHLPLAYPQPERK